MITFAERCGLPVTDWRGFLKRAQAGNVSEAEMRQKIALAARWQTCAIGCQDHRVSGGHMDDVLMQYGARFPVYLSFGQWEMALNTLDAIEALAAELVATMPPEDPILDVKVIETPVHAPVEFMTPQGTAMRWVSYSFSASDALIV